MDCFSSSKHAYSLVNDCLCSSFSGLSVIWQAAIVGLRHTHTIQTAEIGYALSLHLPWQMQRKLHSYFFFFSTLLLKSISVTLGICQLPKENKSFPIINLD